MSYSSVVASLAALVAPWAHVYNARPVLQSVMTVLHVGSMLLAGGLAIAADRATLRATRGSPAVRIHALHELRDVHRPVLVGLAVANITGVLMLAADVEALAASPVLWTKLALLALLLANGWRLTNAEHAMRGEPESDRHWTHLRRVALASLVLWFAVAASGAALVNASA